MVDAPVSFWWGDGCSIRSFMVATVTIATNDVVGHEQTLGPVLKTDLGP